MAFLGLVLLSVYILYAANRRQEFVQRLKDKSKTTLRLLIDVEKFDYDLLQVLDKNTINTLYDEKILLFDSSGKMIYSSIDDTRILFPESLLTQLKAEKNELNYSENDFEIHAQRIKDKGKLYFGISKARDLYGNKKMRFLGLTLLTVYGLAVVGIIGLTRYLSHQISNPIEKLSNEISKFSAVDLSHRVSIPATKDEIALLANRFNSLLERVEGSFVFQRNFIHHLSHELKTPIAVLVSNLEKTMISEDHNNWKSGIEFQKNGLMQIAEVINTLLELSKFESGNFEKQFHDVRLDEVIFDCMSELKQLLPGSTFDFTFDQNLNQPELMTVKGEPALLKIAFLNLLQNALNYSKDEKAWIRFFSSAKGTISIEIQNSGKTLPDSEIAQLFTHFFRGKNSRNKNGVGLGLVMVGKIVSIHLGEIKYSISENGKNKFLIELPALG